MQPGWQICLVVMRCMASAMADLRLRYQPKLVLIGLPTEGCQAELTWVARFILRQFTRLKMGPVSACMGDRLQAGKLSQYESSHPGQLSLASLCG